jgi:hypothetical protein
VGGARRGLPGALERELASAAPEGCVVAPTATHAKGYVAAVHDETNRSLQRSSGIPVTAASAAVR